MIKESFTCTDYHYDDCLAPMNALSKEQEIVMDTTVKDTARFMDWCAVIPGYVHLNRNKRKHLKEKYKMYENTVNITSLKNCFDTLRNNTIPCVSTYNIPREREDTMQNICLEVNARTPATQDPDREKRQYLENRLDRINYTKSNELYKLFGLNDDEEPKNYAEMKARLLAGKYTLPKDRVVDELYDDYDENGPYSDNRILSLRWRDPAKYADKKGKAEAEKEMTTVYTAVKDQIKISDVAAGLVALQAFEAWETTVVPATKAPAA